MLLPRLPGNLPAMCSMAIGFFSLEFAIGEIKIVYLVDAVQIWERQDMSIQCLGIAYQVKNRLLS